MATRFKITQSKEDIIATGGIAMVGALLKDNRGLARVDKMTTDRIKKGWISNSGIIKSVVGLFTLARTDFADIELFRDELAFRLAGYIWLSFGRGNPHYRIFKDLYARC